MSTRISFPMISATWQCEGDGGVLFVPYNSDDNDQLQEMVNYEDAWVGARKDRDDPRMLPKVT